MERSRAFTLIELLVVIIIIAVMSAVVVPAYAKLQSHARFDSAVADVQSLFAEARERAVETGVTTTVTFDRQSETFVLGQASPPIPISDLPVTEAKNADRINQPQAPLVAHLDAETVLVNFQPGSVTGGNGQTTNEVQFKDDGTSDAAQLTLISSSGDSAAFMLFPATGQLIRTDS